MSSAQWCGVVAGGGSPTLVRHHVVDVAGSGGPGAPGKDTGGVAQLGLLTESVGDLVADHADALVEVDHGLDDDLGVGVAAPALDLVGGDATVVVLHPRQVMTVLGEAGDSGVGEVHVEHDLARLGNGCRVALARMQRPGRGRAGVGPRRRQPWHGVRRGTRSQPASLSCSAPRVIAASRSSASARSSSALHERGAVEGDLLVVEGDVTPVGGLLCVVHRLVGHEARDGLGDQTVERAGPIRCANGCDLAVHERCRLRGETEGGLGDPAGLPGASHRAHRHGRRGAGCAGGGTSAPGRGRSAPARSRWNGRSRRRTPRCRTPPLPGHPDPPASAHPRCRARSLSGRSTQEGAARPRSPPRPVGVPPPDPRQPVPPARTRAPTRRCRVPWRSS